MKKLKLFEMFSGYGGASFALKKADIPFETVGYSEIDKYAIQCYSQNHTNTCNYGLCIRGDYMSTPKNFGDCTKINPEEIPDFDLLTGGFPCQSFSVAGKGLGELDTRGTLFNEIIRIAEIKQPKYMLLENVKGLTNKKHKATFDKILSELKRIGYNVNWKVLNSKNYGIPQSRDRVWFMCTRKDLNLNIEFPQPVELKLFLKDILEENVDVKYYLSREKIQKALIQRKAKTFSTGKSRGNLCLDRNDRGYALTLMTSECGETRMGNLVSGAQLRTYPRTKQEGVVRSKRLEVRKDEISNTVVTQSTDNLVKTNGVLSILQVGNTTPKSKRENPQTGRVYNPDGVSPALNCMQGGNRQPQVIITPDTSYCIDANYAKGTSVEQYLIKKRRQLVSDNISIRKLTPTECFRLMGFLDDGINLESLSNTQRYKLAGNGWDINLVSKIFERMFK